MSRMLILAGMALAFMGAGACSFRPITPETASPIGSLDRAEHSRSEAGRMHPDCRDNRADRRDQQDGCREVVRRDR